MDDLMSGNIFENKQVNRHNLILFNGGHFGRVFRVCREGVGTTSRLY